MPNVLHRLSAVLIAVLAMTVAAACGDGGDPAAPGPDGGGDIIDGVPLNTVTGTVVDFKTGATIAGTATVSTVGIEPPPTVTVAGAGFTLTNVPSNSVFTLLVGSPPDYASTYSIQVEVGDGDVTGVEAPAVSNAFLGDMAAAYGVTPSAINGLLIARIKDDGGNYLANIEPNEFQINNAAPPYGPYFLDPALTPDANLTYTSASGYAVFMELPPGQVAVNADANYSLYTMTMTPSPISAGYVTLSTVYANEGAIVYPTNVSFETDVYPIFEKKGCVVCHKGGGQGFQTAGLHLNVGLQNTYKEVVLDENSTRYGISRVNVDYPEESLIIKVPATPDVAVHPYPVFANTQDPDYLLIAGWIAEGALEN